MGLIRSPLRAKIGALLGLFLLLVSGLWLRSPMLAIYHLYTGKRILEQTLRPVYPDRLAPEQVLDEAALERGIRHLEEAVRRDVDDPEPFRLLARAYLSIGEPDQALEILQQAIRLQPEEALLHLDLADVYDSMGRAEDAIREYERGGVGTRRLPLTANYLKLAEAQRAYGGSGDMAIRFWLRALEVDPQNLCALYGLYGIHQEIGDTVTADKYRERLKVAGESDIPLPLDFRLAECQVRAMAGLVEEGLWERETLLGILSSHIWNATDELSIRMVERELDTLLARWPEDPDLLFLRGEFYHRCGDIERAEETYREVIRKAPGYVPAYWRLNIVEKISRHE